MKKMTLCLMLILALVFPVVVSATNVSTDVALQKSVAQVGDTKYSTIEKALDAAMGTEEKVVLLSNATLEGTYQVTDNLTIDLAGFNISATNKLFEVKGAEFTVEGKGMLEETTPDYAPIYVFGSDNVNDTNYTVINVGKDVTLKGWAGIMVKNSAKNHAYGVVVNASGTMIGEKDSGEGTGSAIYVNGSIKDIENCPVINLNSAILTNATGTGVYGAGFAKWNIKDTKITAYEMGVGIKSGIFTLDNVDITVNGPYAFPTGNGNGINATGAAIQIEEYKSYVGKIDLTINSGNFTSENNSALLEYTTSVDGVTFIENIAINGGTFNSAEEKDVITLSDSFKTTITDGFITGGTFSSDVSSYIPAYYVCNQSGSNYVVQKLHDIKVNYTEGGTASSDVIRAYEGRKIGLEIAPDKDYEVKEIKITDASGKATVITDHFFAMPNSAVTVDVTFGKIVKQEVTVPDVVEKDEKVEDILLDSLKKDEDFKDVIENNNVEVKVEVSEEKVDKAEKEEIEEKLEKENITVGKYFDITIAVKNKDTGVTEGTIDELTEEIKFTIEIPEDIRANKAAEGFKRIFYIIRNHEGEIEYLETELSEDETSVSFATDKFSTYVLAYKDEAITTGGASGEGEKEEAPKDEVKEEKIEETTQPDVPNTGDNIVLYVLLAVVAVAGIIVMKKANTKKSKK